LRFIGNFAIKHLDSLSSVWSLGEME